MKKFFKDKGIYLINSLIVLLIFILVLIINKTSPFGSNILGKNEAILEFKPMLFNYITNLKNHTLLNYSFNNGLGNPFIFDFIYYLSSPFNLIAILFKNPDLMYLSTIMLKLIIGSIAITYYTMSKTDKIFIIIIASLSYIFSSWFLAYYYLPFLDIFILFPFFQKGLEDLINKKKNSTFIISLTLLTISNVKLSFAIYIYAIIYYIIYSLIYKKEKKNTTNIFILSTIITLLISTFFIFMYFDALLKTGFSSLRINSDYVITLKDFIKSLFYQDINLTLINNGNTIPNIACNSFILINLIYYFLNIKIDKKDKIFTLIGIVLVLLTIFVKPIDHLFNFFQTINRFTFRYSFIIILLSIQIVIKNLSNLDKPNLKKFFITFIIVGLLLLLSFKQMDTNTLITNICFLFGFLLIITFFPEENITKIIIVCLIIVQSFLAVNKQIPNKTDKEDFHKTTYQTTNNKYRLNTINIPNETFNENMYYNEKVIYLMTDITYNNSTFLINNLGCEGFDISYRCQNSNQIAALLLNIKNDYYLEKVFAVNKDILTTDSGMPETVKDNIERIIFSMTNIKDIYTKETLKGLPKGDNYYFETNHPFYLIEQTGEDKTTYTLPQTYQKFSINKEYSNEEVNIYYLEENKLKEIYDYLTKNQIKYTSYNDNHLEGTIHVDNNQLIYTSIPYDQAWEIKIDGKKVKPTLLLDSLIGIEVEPGDHTISMKYKNTDYIGPALISLITLTGFIIFNTKRKN